MLKDGKPDGDEGEAAAHLEQQIRAAWPWVDDDPNTDLAIIAGMKCYGERCEDLDVVLLGRVGPKGAFAPTLDFYDKIDQATPSFGPGGIAMPGHRGQVTRPARDQV